MGNQQERDVCTQFDRSILAVAAFHWLENGRAVKLFRIYCCETSHPLEERPNKPNSLKRQLAYIRQLHNKMKSKTKTLPKW